MGALTSVSNDGVFERTSRMPPLAICSRGGMYTLCTQTASPSGLWVRVPPRAPFSRIALQRPNVQSVVGTVVGTAEGACLDNDN